MAYSDFKLNEVIDSFGLIIDEASGLFANVSEQECSDLLSKYYGFYIVRSLITNYK
jgi:hypothetical protein